MEKKSKRLNRDVLTICIAIISVCIALFLLFVFFVFARLGVIGPDHRYHRGNYPDLYTVAINSILDSRGYQMYSLPLPARIHVVETDDFGRMLFLYWESNPHWEFNIISAFSLIISQHSYGGYVYFYPHHNFISVRHMLNLPSSDFVPNISQLEEDFTANAIEELKERNSWNQELNLDYAVRVPIVYTKEDRDGPIYRETLLSAGIEVFELEEDERRSPFFHFFITDAYDRSIYVVHGASVGDRRIFVVLFQPDGSFDIDTGAMELLDLQHYQDELKALKQQNGWNQPFP